MKEQIAIVVWDDAVADIGWKSHADVEKPQRCTSIGLIVAEDEKHIVLAGSWGVNGDELQSNNRISIPAQWVVSRKLVQLPKSRK